jgi:hypothetical protein
MFWKWGGKDIRIYGNGAIEGQGSVNLVCPYDKKLMPLDNGGGTSSNLELARKCISIIEQTTQTSLRVTAF